MKEIPLTKGYVALVDDEDFERVSEYKWHPKVVVKKGEVKRVYAYRNTQVDGVWTRQSMHTFILNLGSLGREIGADHRDHNGLNNQQKSNLRIATKTQNMQNMRKSSSSSSNFKGVEFTKRKTPLDNPWRARITLNHKKVQLGYFPDPLNAAAAYDMAAVKLFGEFAYTNFARP